MPLKGKQAEVSLIGNADIQKIKLADISACEESEDKGEYTIVYPYILKFVVADGGAVIQENRSQGSLRARNWIKKFYVHRDSGFVQFWKEQDLLAVFTLFEAQGKLSKKSKSFDLNDLIGFEFDAVVVGYEKGFFIDWVRTFEINDITVPTIEQLGGAPAKTEKKADNSKVDPGDLPF